MFKGSITALVTPMRNGRLDEDAFRAFVDWQIAEGTPRPRAGRHDRREPDAQPRRAQARRRRSASRWRSGRVPVIAGAGSNNTAEAIDLARHAEKAGADAVLVVTPYYNKPNQEGLYQHYKAINDAIGIPIIIYNIPPRSVIDMSVETMARLFELKNIVGVKDATGKIDRISLQRARDGAGLHPALRRRFDRARGHGAWRPRLHLGHLERRAEAPLRVPGGLPRRRLCRRR